MANVWDNPTIDFYSFMEKGRIIGRGSTRIVYRCDREIVIKVPKDRYFDLGQAQNEIEAGVYANASEEQRRFLAKVYHLESDFMVCERLRPVTKNNKIGNIVEHLRSIGKEESAEEIYQFINQLSDQFQLHFMDLFEMGNWGVDKEGNYKLLDYGCTYDLYMQVFDRVG
jgi:hypothetical protein